MELYINSTWTERYENVYVAEAIAWSESGNHATIYATGNTTEEADAKLMDALRELKLAPEASTKSEGVPANRNSGGDEIKLIDKGHSLNPGGRNTPPVK